MNGNHYIKIIQKFLKYPKYIFKDFSYNLIHKNIQSMNNIL